MIKLYEKETGSFGPIPNRNTDMPKGQEYRTNIPIKPTTGKTANQIQ